MRYLLILLVLVFCVSLSFGQTYISGAIMAEYEFNIENNPYIITEDLNLIDNWENPDAPFVIPPGIEFYAQPYVYISVQATNFSCGSIEGDPVIFSAENSDAGWQGISSYYTNESMNFDNVIIEYVKESEFGAVLAEQNDFSFTNSEIRFSENENASCITTFENNFIITGNRFHHNTYDFHCTLFHFMDSNGAFEYNVIDHNSAEILLVLVAENDLTINHCTFFNNYTVDSSMLLDAPGHHLTIINTIVWNEEMNPDLEFAHAEELEIAYSCIYDNSFDGEGVIYDNPLLTGTEDGLFELDSGSPCILAGETQNWRHLPDDIGAHEYDWEDTALLRIMPTVASQLHPATFEIYYQFPHNTQVTSISGIIELPPSFFQNDNIDYAFSESSIIDTLSWTFGHSFSQDVITFNLEGSNGFNEEGLLFTFSGIIDQNVNDNVFYLPMDEWQLNNGNLDVVSYGGHVIVQNNPMGDANLDHSLDISDAQLIHDYLAGETTLDYQQSQCANVSGDLRVDEYDSALILNYLNESIGEFPIVSGEIYEGSAVLLDNELDLIPEDDNIYFPLSLSQVENVYSLSFDLNIPDDLVFESIEAPENSIVSSFSEENTTTVFISFNEVENSETFELENICLTDADNSHGRIQIMVNNLRINSESIPNQTCTLTLNLPILEVKDNNLPAEFTLLKTWPNPFNPSLNIISNLEKAGHLKITIYDILGRQVSSIVNTKVEAGLHRYIFDATNLAAGTYYVRANNSQMGTQIKQVVLIK